MAGTAKFQFSDTTPLSKLRFDISIFTREPSSMPFFGLLTVKNRSPEGKRFDIIC